MGLTEWAGDEQKHLWSDLDEAIRYANNGAWSIRAANIAQRIVEVARLVGPADPGAIPYRLSAGGVYQAVLRAGGVEPILHTEQEWQRFDAMMEKYGTTRAIAVPELAATVAAVNTPRERSWISGESE